METVFRLLDTGPGEPAFNMAVDEVLLAGAEARPTLRLYAWSPPALSLGYFQELESAPAIEDAVIVRRLTGGGAIRHRDELTFAVAAPIAMLGGTGKGVRASFEAVNRAVAAGLRRLGVDALSFSASEASGSRSRSRSRTLAFENENENENDAAPTSPFLCYDRRSSTDLLFRGRKLVGSAQRRQGRCVLQHGSVPIGAESFEANRLTVSAAAGRPMAYHQVASAIAEGFREALGARLERAALDPGEDRAARELAREKYGARSWTARR